MGEYLIWTAIYLLQMAFWVWIAFFGGAQRLEGTFTSGFLVSIFALRWSADGIRLFAFIMLFISTISFGIGLFVEDYRLYMPL